MRCGEREEEDRIVGGALRYYDGIGGVLKEY